MNSIDLFLQRNRLWLIVFPIIVFAVLLNLHLRYGGKKKRLLFFLRLLLYLLILFVFLQPVRTVQELPSEKPSITFLIDTSRSMDVRDPISRFTLVKEFLKGSLVTELKNKYKLHFFTFDAELRASTMDSVLELTPQGEATDIAHALKELEKEIPSDTLSGVFLVTDGVFNSGPDPRFVAESINCPIFAIGVGSPRQARDIQISEIQVSDFAFKNTEIDIIVVVQSYGFPGKDVSLILSKDSDVIKTTKITLPEDGKDLKVKLSFVPRATGLFRYQVSIPPYKDEASITNNKKEFSLQVLRDKIRILYVCGQPSWEYRFLRMILKADPAVELVSFIILRNPEDVALVPDAQLSLIPFPVTEIFSKEIFNFDLLIFENFTYSRFNIPLTYLDNVRKFVQERGGAFLMLGGDNSFGKGGYKRTPIDAILPVEMEGTGEQTTSGKFRMLVREFTHPILAFSSVPGETGKAWEKMPELDGLNHLLREKPGALVLGVHPLLKNQYGNLIVMAVWETGKGRVMAIATNTTWRWYFQERGAGAAGSYYEQFWRQAIQWLVKSPQLEPVRLSKNKEAYKVGEEIGLRIRALDNYYRPCAEARVELEITDRAGRKNYLGTAFPTDIPGEYKAEYTLEKEGNYTFTASVWKGSQFLGRDSIDCTVTGLPLELENVQLNEPLLKEMAELTGGQYFQISSVQGEKISLPDTRKPRPVIKRVIPIWNNPLLFCIFPVLFGAEWYIRRRSGLM